MNKRTYRKIKKGRNRKVKRFRFYFLIAIIISLSVFGFRFVEKNNSIKEASAMKDLTSQEDSSDTSSLNDQVDDNSFVTEPNIDHKELGQIESIIEYGSEGLIGAHYPVFGKTNIDTMNKDLVNKYIDKFKEELGSNSEDHDKDYKYELSIDYDTYKGPNDLVSIIFYITESGSYLAHPDSNVVTKVYDLLNDKEVKLLDIINDGDMETISQISKEYFTNNETYKDSIDSDLFKEGISGTEENYSNFILKENSILFIFNKYQLFSGNFGAPSIEMPYLELKDYIKIDLSGLGKNDEESSKIVTETEKPRLNIELPNRVLDPDKPMIALTFDDGPNKKITGPILDTLKEYDSVATFFILGNRVDNNVDILERILEEGSEIGNHSYNHKELTKLSYDELSGQITNTQNAVFEGTGTKPKLMRPTYGSFDDNLKSSVDMPLILWSIDTLDWKSRNSKKVTDHVLANVKDGDIVLMHDIYESTGEAVKLIVPELIKRGYQLVTVSELFESRGEVLKGGQIYNKMYKK